MMTMLPRKLLLLSVVILRNAAEVSPLFSIRSNDNTFRTLLYERRILIKNGKIMPTYVTWAEARVLMQIWWSASMSVVTVSGDRGDFERQYGRFFPIELPPVISFFANLNLLLNLVDCPCLEHIVLIFVVHSYMLVTPLRWSEMRKYKVLMSWHKWVGILDERADQQEWWLFNSIN
jgi:hypothetical protein